MKLTKTALKNMHDDADMIDARIKRGRNMQKEYKERNHGITRKSTKFLNDHISKIGVVVCVEGTKDGTAKNQYSLQGDYWTTFSDRDGNKIVISGFAWGYYGEGPRGLEEALKLVGWKYTSQKSSQDIANFKDTFKISR